MSESEPRKPNGGDGISGCDEPGAAEVDVSGAGSKWQTAAKVAREHPVWAWVGIVGSIFGIAGTIFGIIDFFRDDEAGANSPVATSTPSAEQVRFSSEISAICQTWEEHTQPAIARDFKRLRRNLNRAETSLDQSAHLISYHRRAALHYRSLRNRFAALAPSRSDRKTHEEVAATWRRAIDTYDGYRAALTKATTRAQILKAAHDAESKRAALERDADLVSEGLLRLGAGDCDLPAATPRTALRLPVPASEREQGQQLSKSVTLPLVDVAQPEILANAGPPDDSNIWIAWAIAVAGGLAAAAAGVQLLRAFRNVYPAGSKPSANAR